MCKPAELGITEQNVVLPQNGYFLKSYLLKYLSSMDINLCNKTIYPIHEYKMANLIIITSNFHPILLSQLLNGVCY